MMTMRTQRARRILYRILLAAAGAAMLTMLAYWLLLPWSVRVRVGRSLAQLGDGHATFNVAALWPRGLRLDALELGSPNWWLRADTALLEYDLASLQQQRLRTIELIGAEWRVRVVDGEIDWGFPAFDNAAHEIAAVPFDMLRVQASTLAVDLDGEVCRYPLSGIVRQRDQGQFLFDLAISIFNQPLHLVGRVQNASDETQFDFSIMPNEEDGAEDTANRVRVHGAVVNEHGAAARTSLTAHMHMQWDHIRMPIGEYLAEGRTVTVSMRGTLNTADPQQLLQLEGEAHVQQLRVGEHVIDDIHFVIAPSDHGPMFTASASYGDDALQLRRLDGSIDELITVIMDHPGAAATFQWQVQGDLAQLLRAPLHAADVALTSHDASHATGHLLLQREADSAWVAHLPHIEVQLAQHDVAMASRALYLDELAGTLHLSAEASADELRVWIGDESTVQARSVRLMQQHQPDGSSQQHYLIQSAPMQSAITARDSTLPALRMTFSTPASLDLNIGMRSLAALSFDSNDMRITMPQWSADASITRAATQPLSIDATFATHNAAVFDDKLDLALKGISASIPLQQNIQAHRTGEFAVQTVQWRDAQLPGPAGTVGFTNGRIDAHARWPVMTSATLTADAWLTFAGDRPRAQVSANIPETTIANFEELHGLIPALQNYQAAGRFSLDAHIEMDGDEIKPLIHIRAENARLAGRDLPLVIEDAEASIIIDNFSPLSTPASQRIEIARARVGELELSEGVVQFRIERADSVFVEQLVWTLTDRGSFHASAFRFDPAQPHITATIYCENLDLDRWLSQLTDDRARGTGRLRGLLVVVLEPSAQNPLRIVNGILVTQPESGVLQVRDAEALGRLLEDADPQFAGDAQLAEVKDRIVAALTDFEYSMLRIDFERRGEEVLCRIELRGRGRQGPQAQEIGSLVININQFGTLLRMKTGIDRLFAPTVGRQVDR